MHFLASTFLLKARKKMQAMKYAKSQQEKH